MEYDPRHCNYILHYYCILKAMCHSGKGIKESGAASDGEMCLGQNLGLSLDCLLLFAVQVNSVV